MDGNSRPKNGVSARIVAAGDGISTFIGDKAKNADKVYLDFGNRSSDFDRTPGGVQQQIFDFQQWARGRLYSGGCGDADLQP